MEKEGVGLLVVVEEERPVGVLSDRDIALEALAARRDPAVTRVEDAMTKRPVTIPADAPIADAGEPADVVTDRDLVIRVVAPGLDPDATLASAIMSSPAITAQASDPLEQVVATMRTRGVRRIPILSDGRLSGIVAFDDLLVAFGEELRRLGRATGARRTLGAALRPGGPAAR